MDQRSAATPVANRQGFAAMNICWELRIAGREVSEHFYTEFMFDLANRYRKPKLFSHACVAMASLPRAKNEKIKLNPN